MLYSITPTPLSYTFKVWKGRKIYFIIRKKLTMLCNQAFTRGPENVNVLHFSWSLLSDIVSLPGVKVREILLSSVPHGLNLSFFFHPSGFPICHVFASGLYFVEVELEISG
jgi:hypothetical protein